jgi:hypothetical protein
VVKILDTHDRKSGRREVLAAHGIAPEYFYTVESEEKIALSRADLVWAIKDEERVFFERLADTPAITLPHLDPARALSPPEPDREGYLRAGILAARNNINQVNIRNFIRLAEPLVNAAFAPVKLVIAGTVCDLLRDVDCPLVELRGRVDDVDEFYESVDCAVIPMTFSTGLKIKTGEAISAGLPVLSTAHAFEGFQASDKMHALPDFAALAQALVDLSFAPRGQLEELALASRLTYAATKKQISQALDRTLDFVRQKQHSMVLAVDSRAFVHDSVFNLVLRSAHDYLRWLGTVSVLVVKGSAADVAAGARLADELGRVIVADDLDGAAKFRAALAGRHVETVNVEDYLARTRTKVIVADALHQAFHKPCCADSVIFARSELIALSEGTSGSALPGEDFRRAFVVAPRPSRPVAAQARNGAAIVLAPCFNRSNALNRPLRREAGTPLVVLMGAPRTRAMALALALAEAWDMKSHVVCGLGEAGAVPVGAGGTPAAAYAEDLVTGRAVAPLFALDLSGGQPGLQLCREVLERLGVPVVTAASSAPHPALGMASLPATVATEFEMFEVFRAFALRPETRNDPAFESARSAMNADRGWAYLWAFCRRLFETQDPEFA